MQSFFEACWEKYVQFSNILKQQQYSLQYRLKLFECLLLMIYSLQYLSVDYIFLLDPTLFQKALLQGVPKKVVQVIFVNNSRTAQDHIFFFRWAWWTPCMLRSLGSLQARLYAVFIAHPYTTSLYQQLQKISGRAHGCSTATLQVFVLQKSFSVFPLSADFATSNT